MSRILRGLIINRRFVESVGRIPSFAQIERNEIDETQSTGSGTRFLNL
jgi:hypothetical protein